MLGEAPEPQERSGKQRLAIAAGSLGVTGLALTLAMMVGTWGFEQRSSSLHRGRLERLVDRAPSLDRVVAGLADEGTLLVDSADAPAALRALAQRWGGAHADEILEKGGRWSLTRAFEAEGYVYVLYFDAQRVLQDFTCVPR